MTNKQMNFNQNKKGFTLLELLIVIAILAILAGVMIFILNPAETLKKARDSQRLSDLATMKSALGIYMSSIATPNMTSSTNANANCSGGSGTATVYLSFATTTNYASDASTSTTSFAAFSATSTTSINGSGWVPVNLTALAGGSPISGWPLDPTNGAGAVASGAGTATSSLIYRYACKSSPVGFKLEAQLESLYYTGQAAGSTNLLTADYGVDSNMYEVGTDMSILPATASAGPKW